MALKINRALVLSSDYPGNFVASPDQFTQGLAISFWIRPDDVGNIEAAWPSRRITWLSLGLQQFSFQWRADALQFIPTIRLRNKGGLIDQFNSYSFVPNYPPAINDLSYNEWYHVFFKVYVYLSGGAVRAKYDYYITDAYGNTVRCADRDDYQPGETQISPFNPTPDWDIEIKSANFNSYVGFNALDGLRLPKFEAIDVTAGAVNPPYQVDRNDFPQVTIDRLWISQLDNLDQFNAITHTDFRDGSSLNFMPLGPLGQVKGITPRIYTYGNKGDFWFNRGLAETGAQVFTDNINFVGQETISRMLGQASVTSTASLSCSAGVTRPAAASLLDNSSRVIAAPGRTLLGSVELDAEFSTEGETNGLFYAEEGYFNSELGFYVQGSTYQGFKANVVYSPTLPLSVEFIPTFFGGVTYSNSQCLIEQPVFFYSLAKNNISAQGDFEQDSSLTAQPATILSTNYLFEADLDTANLGNQIHDIGIHYAYDWADDYFSPILFLTISTESLLYAAASVELIPEANLSASSDIVGVGGYFDAGAQMINGGQADFSILPVLTGGVGLLFSQETQLSTDTEQQVLGGLLFDGQSQLDTDTEFTSEGGRYQLIAGTLNSDFLFTNATDLFKSTVISLESNADVLATGGKYWSAQTQLVADFLVPDIRSRIISIDEYYVDKVTREIRTITVFQDQRHAFIPLESRSLRIFREDRINQVDYEMRNLRLEPGTPIQVGSRNRRITA